MTICNVLMKLIIVLAVLVSIFCVSGAVYAQTEEGSTFRPITLDEMWDEKSVYSVTDEYLPSSIENLSKLYWALGALDINDDLAVENYLKINECELYNKYFGLDLEMTALMKSTRQHIVQNLGKFSNKLEFIIPVEVEEYDAEKQEFALAPNSQMFKVKRMQLFEAGLVQHLCVGKSAFPGYPSTVTLNFPKPLTITGFKVPLELAEVYMTEMRRLVALNPSKYTLTKYGRIAHLRLKVTILRHRGIEKQSGASSNTSANSNVSSDLLAEIDGYEFYADKGKNLLLSRTVIDKKRTLKRRLKSQATGDAVQQTQPPAAQVPGAPAGSHPEGTGQGQ